MNETATVKQRIADKVKQLAGLAKDSNQGQAAMLEQELQQLLSQHMPEDAAPPIVVKGRSTAESVERCPVCMIRGLRPIRGAQSTAVSSGTARLYRCSSCGHEEWRAA